MGEIEFKDAQVEIYEKEQRKYGVRVTNLTDHEIYVAVYVADDSLVYLNWS
jgi:hypothetical protein